MTRPEWYTGVVQRAGCLTASTQTANVNCLLIADFLREVSEGTRTPDRLDHNRIPRDFLGGCQSPFAGISWFELPPLLLRLMDKLMDARRAKAALTSSASFAAGA
jgi:hypothetical protein